MSENIFMMHMYPSSAVVCCLLCRQTYLLCLLTSLCNHNSFVLQLCPDCFLLMCSLGLQIIYGPNPMQTYLYVFLLHNWGCLLHVTISFPYIFILSAGHCNVNVCMSVCWLEFEVPQGRDNYSSTCINTLCPTSMLPKREA